MLKIEKVSSIDDFENLVEFQNKVWESSYKEAVPSNLLINCEKIGGLSLAAYNIDNQLVGFTFSIPAFDKEKIIYHYLHLLGVSKENRSENIGFLLMQKHKKLSLKQGIKRIDWTFDPFQTTNANLYLRKLGAVIENYIPDYYGKGLTGINQGLPTDRVFAKWDLTKEKKEITPSLENYTILDIKDNKLSKVHNLKTQKVAIKIPSNFQEIKTKNKELAQEIQESLRQIFIKVLKRKQIIDFLFIKEENLCFYLTN